MDRGLAQLLQAVDKRPTLATYMQTSREVPLFQAQLHTARLALLATFTVDSLVPYLHVEAARQGFAADIYVAPFNAISQEFLDPGSGCRRHRPDIVFVAQLLSDICPPLANDYLRLESAEIDRYIEETITGLVATLREFRQSSPAAIVLHNFALPAYPLFGIYEVMAPQSQTGALRQLNARLAAAVQAVPAVYVLDFDRLCATLGYQHCFDTKMWYLGRAPLSAPTLPLLARTQAAFIQALLGSPRKCLVLDLDNTLWGGVWGEGGVRGIKVAPAFPGSAFRDFQQVVLQLHRQGVILAINSKNNPADVEEVFRTHPDMVLRPEHFASLQINWRAKPDNMVQLAAEINIGLDSLVFFDDSPAERDLMRQALPQVLTLEVPADPLQYANILLASQAFDKLSLTEEDRQRGATYRDQRARRQWAQSATSLQDFYERLQMVVNIQRVGEFALPRVVDLLHKTNQFNLTTRRYTAAELAEILADPRCGVFYLQVTDRFGDNGIVGVAIARHGAAVVELDTFLLSCRVLGRTVETAFLSFLLEWARAAGSTAVEGTFIPTAKNTPAADFYARHGFTPIPSTGAGSRWRLQLADVAFQWPSYIQQTDEERKPK